MLDALINADISLTLILNSSELNLFLSSIDFLIMSFNNFLLDLPFEFIVIIMSGGIECGYFFRPRVIMMAWLRIQHWSDSWFDYK